MKIRIFLAQHLLSLGLLVLALVSSTPPDDDDMPYKNKFAFSLELVPVKRLRSNQEYHSVDEVSNPFKLNIKNYEELTTQIDAVIEKFDIVSGLIYASSPGETERREKEFLHQLKKNLYIMRKERVNISPLPVLYYTENVKETKVNAYRNKMIQALVYIKINMSNVAMEFFKGVNDAIRDITLYQIFDEWDNEDKTEKQEIDKEIGQRSILKRRLTITEESNDKEMEEETEKEGPSDSRVEETNETEKDDEDTEIQLIMPYLDDTEGEEEQEAEEREQPVQRDEETQDGRKSEENESESTESGQEEELAKEKRKLKSKKNEYKKKVIITKKIKKRGYYK